MPRFAANLTLLFAEHDFMDRFGAARRAGFDGVEFLFPYAWDPEELRDRLLSEKLQQVLFNLPPGDWDKGERGIACHPDRVSEFREGVDLALDYADRLDCHQLNCLAGLVPQGLGQELALETLRDNVRWAADRLAQSGRILLLEAINSRVDMPGFLLDGSSKTIELLQSVNRDNVRFQFDLYHMQIMEGDLIRSLERCLPWIGHIQFADNPGRHEPGTGEIAFAQVFQALDRMGYRGWVSAEYRPLGRTEDSLSWFSEERRQ